MAKTVVKLSAIKIKATVGVWIKAKDLPLSNDGSGGKEGNILKKSAGFSVHCFVCIKFTA